MKPSELPENGCIRIISDQGCIEFHRSYDDLGVAAVDRSIKNLRPRSRAGIRINMSIEAADDLYEEYRHLIENRRLGRDPRACDDVKIIEWHDSDSLDPTVVI